MEDSQNKIIDLGAIFVKFLKYWKLFLICLISSILLAIVYDKSTSSNYFVKASVYVNSGNNALDATSLIFSSQLSANPEEVINQSIIIKSFPLLEKVFKQLDFSVSYFKESFFKKEELYNNKPFQVVLSENSKNIPYNNVVLLTFTDEEHFLLTLEGSDPITEKEIFFEGDFSIGETIDVNGCVFSINKVEKYSVNLDDEYAFVFNKPEELLYSYSTRLIVEVEQESSSIIKVKIEGSQKEKLTDFLNTLLRIYFQNNLEEKNEAITNSIAFMEREIVLIGDSLSLLDGQLEKFKSSNQINDINREVGLVLDELSSLEKEKMNLKLRENYFDYLLKNLSGAQENASFRIPSTAGIQDPILSNLISQLISNTIRRKTIIAASKTNSPLLYNIESNIMSLKTEILENVSSQKEANSVSIELVDFKLSLVRKNASKFPAVERELINLTRSYELYENLFLLLQQNKTEAEVLRSENKADFRIIEPARLESLEPIISRKVYYITAIGLGLILATFIFIIKLVYTDKVESIKELSQIEGVPFLGAVSKVNSWTLDYIVKHPKSKFTETLRILLGNLSFITNKNEGKGLKIMFNSVDSGEGKSYLCTNLSILLSHIGKKVVLIDADLRSPSLGDLFNKYKASGISHYLKGSSTIEEIISPSGYESLDLILSSAIPPNPSDLLSSPKFAELLENLEKTYDYVIIDTPPMGMVIDPLIINKHVDANIIVIREDYSKLSYLDVIRRIQGQNRLGNCGVVLNDSDSAFKHTYSEKYYIDDYSNLTLGSKLKSFFKGL